MAVSPRHVKTTYCHEKYVGNALATGGLRIKKTIAPVQVNEIEVNETYLIINDYINPCNHCKSLLVFSQL